MEESPRVPQTSFPRRAVAYLVYVAVRAAETAVLSLPPSAADRLAVFAANLLYRFDGERRRTALENLRVAFREAVDGAAREALARRSFVHAFRVGVEAIRRPRVLRSRRAWERRVRPRGDGRE